MIWNLDGISKIDIQVLICINGMSVLEILLKEKMEKDYCSIVSIRKDSDSLVETIQERRYKVIGNDIVIYDKK